jgi:hypothetical protein
MAQSPPHCVPNLPATVRFPPSVEIFLVGRATRQLGISALCLRQVCASPTKSAMAPSFGSQRLALAQFGGDTDFRPSRRRCLATRTPGRGTDVRNAPEMIMRPALSPPCSALTLQRQAAWLDTVTMQVSRPMRPKPLYSASQGRSRLHVTRRRGNRLESIEPRRAARCGGSFALGADLHWGESRSHR